MPGVVRRELAPTNQKRLSHPRLDPGVQSARTPSPPKSVVGTWLGWRAQGGGGWYPATSVTGRRPKPGLVGIRRARVPPCVADETSSAVGLLAAQSQLLGGQDMISPVVVHPVEMLPA